MALFATDLLNRVREKTDESNTESVSDPFILRSLNEAQRSLVRIAARQYEQIFIEHTTLVTDGSNLLVIPEDAFDRRIEFVEVEVASGIWRKLDKEQSKRVGQYSSSVTSALAVAYSTKQNKIILLPTPASGKNVRVWYTRRPKQLVASYGRIIDIDTGAGTITLESLSSSVSTDVDSLAAFINVVDATTGLVKGSYQVASAASNVVTIKAASLDRAAVAGQTISTTLASTIEVDDYICAINGTCVMELLADYSDYIIQYAVVDIRRALREDTTPDYAHLKDLEKELETIWSGRELGGRVTNRNPHWR
jgi:hypothetical protein